MWRLLVLGATMVTTSVGCTTMSMGPGAVRPGALFSNVTYPNYLNPGMEHEISFSGQDIEVIGPVKAEATSYNVLGIVSWGDGGYGELLDKAREAGGESVMNVTVDTRFVHVGLLWLYFYHSAQTELSGIAYKYRRP